VTPRFFKKNIIFISLLTFIAVLSSCACGKYFNEHGNCELVVPLKCANKKERNEWVWPKGELVGFINAGRSRECYIMEFRVDNLCKEENEIKYFWDGEIKRKNGVLIADVQFLTTGFNDCKGHKVFGLPINFRLLMEKAREKLESDRETLKINFMGHTETLEILIKKRN